MISSATTVEEARWLEARGCDAIIAQGAEAGGHRGMFLATDIAQQAGTFALVPQIVDAVKVPVIAAGGIGDGRGIAAALALGAAGAQIGTAYLLSPEASTAPLHRAAIRQASDDSTALTNVFTGRPARGIVNRFMREVGPMSAEAPAFPLAAGAAQPLRGATEPNGSSDFMPLWSGQAPTLAREMPSGELTRRFVSKPKRRSSAREDDRVESPVDAGTRDRRVAHQQAVEEGPTRGRGRGRCRLGGRSAVPLCSVPAAGGRRRGCAR